MFAALLPLASTFLGGSLAAKGQKELLKKQLEGQLEVEKQRTQQIKTLAIIAAGVAGLIGIIYVAKRRAA